MTGVQHVAADTPRCPSSQSRIHPPRDGGEQQEVDNVEKLRQDVRRREESDRLRGDPKNERPERLAAPRRGKDQTIGSERDVRHQTVLFRHRARRLHVVAAVDAERSGAGDVLQMQRQ